MKYEDVEKLTSDEVRVAVSEAWYGGKCDKELGGIVVQPTQDNLFAGGIFPLLDLADPRCHIALMNEIWETKDGKDAGITKDDIHWNHSYSHDGGLWGTWNGIIYYGIYETIKELWEAIARAWLVICGDE